MQQKIEILGLEIFKTHEKEMNIVEKIKRDLNWEIGWHYHLDLAWMLREVCQAPPGSLILDAGAGKGLAQFLLAELGYNVISVDLVKRFYQLSQVRKYGSVVYPLNKPVSSLKGTQNRAINRMVTYFKSKVASDSQLPSNPLDLIEMKRYVPSPRDAGNLPWGEPGEYGRIFVCESDLKDMAFLPNDFVDGVISISALEHNRHQDLSLCLNEMLRVLKPGGVLALTVSASLSEDWFHRPSKGWCYSEASLRNLFQLPEGTLSNFDKKEELMNLLKRDGNELHQRLDAMYYRSGNNGMPWGKWNPRYLPVGIVKHKRNG